MGDHWPHTFQWALLRVQTQHSGFAPLPGAPSTRCGRRDELSGKSTFKAEIQRSWRINMATVSMFYIQEAVQRSSGQSLAYGLCHLGSQFIKMAERKRRLRRRCSLEVLAAALLSGCDVPQHPEHGSHPDLSSHIWRHLYLHCMASSVCLVNPSRLVQMSSIRVRNFTTCSLSPPPSAVLYLYLYVMQMVKTIQLLFLWRALLLELEAVIPWELKLTFLFFFFKKKDQSGNWWIKPPESNPNYWGQAGRH